MSGKTGKAAEWLTGIATPRTLGNAMSGMFGAASTPQAPSIPAPPPPPPMLNSPQGLAAGDAARRRAAAANGYGSTIITGPMGDTSQTNNQKTLTGG